MLQVDSNKIQSQNFLHVTTSIYLQKPFFMKQNNVFFKSAGKSRIGFGQMFKTALILLAVLVGHCAQAQTSQGRFLTFDFSAITSASIPTTVAAYSANAAINTTGLSMSRGTGLVNGTAVNGFWVYENVNETSESNAVNDYLEIPINLNAGYEARLDSLIWFWKFSNNNVNLTFFIRSSQDNYATTLATATISSGAAAGNTKRSKLTLSTPLLMTSNTTLRFYTFNSGNNNRDVRLGDSSLSTSIAPDFQLWGRTSNTIKVLQAFDFTGRVGNETTLPTYTCDVDFIDTAGVRITRGPGTAAQTTTAGSFGASSLNNTSQANAISNDDYFQFAMNPKFGMEYSLDRLQIRYFSSATIGPNAFALRSSADNYATNIAAGTLVRGTQTTQLIRLTSQLVTDSPITFRMYVWGAILGGFRFTDGTGTTSFNNDIEFIGEGTTARIPKATLSAPGVVTNCLGGGIPLKVSTLGGTPPFTVWLKDNLGLQRTHVQSQADSTFTIFPQSNRTYTLDSVKDANGNKADSLAGSVAVTITASPIARDTNVYVRTLNHLDGYTLTYADGSLCRSWITIADAAGGTNPGSTTCTATVLSAIPINNTSRYFLSRHVRVQPTNNGNATLTLFFTQQEFTAFNTAALYHQKLPANPSDTVGVLSKLLVRRTQGSNETANLSTFTPSSVTWNAASEQWQVTFAVNDAVLGGFYYVSTPFSTSNMVTTVTHSAATPALGQTSANMTIDWNDVPGVTQYRLRIRPQGGNWNPSTITGSQRIMNLTFNTTYEVQVRVYESASVQGEYTTTYTFTTPQQPAKMPDCSLPTNITSVVNSPVSASLSWTGALFGINYQVQLRPKNSLVWGGSSSTGNSINFATLSPGTTYEYRIRTTCLDGYTTTTTSSFSNIDTFVTPSMQNCGTVTNVSTESTTTNSGTISWSPVSFASSYQVQTRLKNTGSWGGTTVTGTTHTFDNLASGAVYEYRVRALCNGVPLVTNTTTGAFTATNEFTTASAPALGTCLPPTNIAAVPTTTSLNVSWDAVANGALYFVNIKQENASTWGGTSVSSLNRTFNNLLPATNYQVRIRTTCAQGTTLTPSSVFSDTVLFTTTALANKAIFDNESTNLWQVYPNPTQGQLHINFNSNTNESIRVDVRDMTGRMVQSNQFEALIGQNTLDINLASVVNGLYIVQIYQGATLTFMNRVQKTH
jgi:hypothetical protein